MLQFVGLNDSVVHTLSVAAGRNIQIFSSVGPK